MSGLTSSAFDAARTVAIALALVFWLGLATWVHLDARRRSEDVRVLAAASVLGLVPYLGSLVYLLLRPAETLADARLRLLETRALEAQAPGRACPGCSAEVEAAFLVCPHCAERLRHPCRSCAAPLEPAWRTCPYCATAVEPVAALAGELLAAVAPPESAPEPLAATGV